MRSSEISSATGTKKFRQGKKNNTKKNHNRNYEIKESLKHTREIPHGEFLHGQRGHSCAAQCHIRQRRSKMLCVQRRKFVRTGSTANENRPKRLRSGVCT